MSGEPNPEATCDIVTDEIVINNEAYQFHYQPYVGNTLIYDCDGEEVPICIPGRANIRMIEVGIRAYLKGIEVGKKMGERAKIQQIRRALEIT